MYCLVQRAYHCCRVSLDLNIDEIFNFMSSVLWAGTPIITWPKHRTKMCSRVGASIAYATGFGNYMVVDSLDEYEARAIRYARSVWYESFQDGSGAIRRRGRGDLMELRRNLYLNREEMPLFDTLRWTRNLEKGLAEAWRRWIAGTCFGNIHYTHNELFLTSHPRNFRRNRL